MIKNLEGPGSKYLSYSKFLQATISLEDIKELREKRKLAAEKQEHEKKQTREQYSLQKRQSQPRSIYGGEEVWSPRPNNDDWDYFIIMPEEQAQLARTNKNVFGYSANCSQGNEFKGSDHIVLEGFDNESN